MIRCAISYHLYNLKNVKNTHGEVLISCNFAKINTPPWVFFTFFKLCKWYQIAQRTTFVLILIRRMQKSNSFSQIYLMRVGKLMPKMKMKMKKMGRMNFWILQIKIRLYDNFHENLWKKLLTHFLRHFLLIEANRRWRWNNLEYRILSFKRPGRLYIFFDFGVGVYWRGVLNREGRSFKKLDFLSNSLLSLEAIQ